MLKNVLVLRPLALSNSRSMSSLINKDQFWHSGGGKKKKNSKKAAVLVCGWAGSKRSNVEKYTELFSQRFGLETFGCILPMVHFTSFDHDGMSDFATNVLTEMSRKIDADDVDLVLHTLSNNGASVYQHVVELCKDGNAFKDKFRISGAVFDSGPGWPLLNFAFSSTS